MMEIICELKTKYLVNRDDSEEKVESYEGLSSLYMILLSKPISPGSYPDEQRLPIAAISAFPGCTPHNISSCIDCHCGTMPRQYVCTLMHMIDNFFGNNIASHYHIGVATMYTVHS